MASRDGFASRLERVSAPMRWLVAMLAAVGGIGLLAGGRLLVQGGGWVEWLALLLFLEPAGILAVLAAIVFAEPRAPLAAYLSDALLQRHYAAATFVIVSLALLLEAVRFLVRDIILSHLR